MSDVTECRLWAVALDGDVFAAYSRKVSAEVYASNFNKPTKIIEGMFRADGAADELAQSQARVAELESRLATAEADALRRAAEVCEKYAVTLAKGTENITGKYIEQIYYGHCTGARNCRDAILALIPKEST